MDLFNNQWNSNLGSVGRTPTETSLYLEEGIYENDVYQFEVEEAGDLNISLVSSPGDDADLELYHDTNDNGYLDAGDQLIAGSYNEADVIDLVELEDATEDTYFARVTYYDGGDDNYLNYDLSLYTEESETSGDLFPNEFTFDIGTIGRTPYETSTVLIEGQYENDIYHFNLDEIGDLDISLNNLAAYDDSDINLSAGDDADLELYHDTNANGVLDANDQLIQGSYNGGNADESIRYEDAPVGDYFARVSYYDGNDDQSVYYDLDIVSEEPVAENLFGFNQYNFDLGNIDRTTVDRSTFLLEGVYENDVYEFSVSETSDLDLSLSSLDAEDDADLQLYHDTNANGILDVNDSLIQGSYNLAGLEDVINYDQAVAGTYFAHVDYYSGGVDGIIDYDLSISADNYVNNENRFELQSNLYLGHIGRTPTETSLYLQEGVYENDAYEFVVEEAGDLDLSLDNLSYGDDADLSLYRDSNHNGILDTDDEFLTGSYNFGDQAEFIRFEDISADTYFANVSYYDGGDDGYIDYTLAASVESDDTPHYGDLEGELILGTDYADYLTGTAHNDTIRGYYGSDELHGGDGDDVLNGSYVGNEAINYIYLGEAAYNEYDVLTGGEGADTFVLGTEYGSNYQMYGYSDYALITDFNWYEGDTIQVYGVAEDYSIAEYNGGTDIYYQSELIGHVENTTDVIISADFHFCINELDGTQSQLIH